MTVDEFEIQFKCLTGWRPFPWQTSLWEEMVHKPVDQWPDAVDIPTGLGKTHVITVWYLAWRATSDADTPTRLPRRLVYVVNRRTVVDQTTAEVERLRENLADDERLAISTLRGQFADNSEWSADPSRPAVICGTVDMIGSRLLFAGYRIGFKSRPLHAAFLGQDALLVHDEAHLEPAFQAHIERIQQEQHQGEHTGDLPWPKLRVMALTATKRRATESDADRIRVFTLTEKERNPPEVIPNVPSEPIHHVWCRLKAVKHLELHSLDMDSPVDKVVELAMRHAGSGAAVLVFLRYVKDVTDVAGRLVRKLKKERQKRVQTLTGSMRGKERDELVKSDPVFARFMPPSSRAAELVMTEGTVYLVCTSAGEVGVDLSADHMVCDLSTFDSMAQRLGRVNRYGDREDTRIDVAYSTEFDSEKHNLKVEERRERTLGLLRQLDGEASPLALGQLDADARERAFAPEPEILAATDVHVSQSRCQRINTTANDNQQAISDLTTC